MSEVCPICFCIDGDHAPQKYMKEILTAKGDKIVVDDESYPYLSIFKWHINNGYARNWSKHKGSKGKQTGGYMHEILLWHPAGYIIDHINGNELDNRMSNLRICNDSQNGMNKKISSNNTSGFKGVAKSRSGKWRAYITKNKKQHQVGVFNTKKEAAIAYNNAAINMFGEFAKLNLIQ